MGFTKSQICQWTTGLGLKVGRQTITCSLATSLISTTSLEMDVAQGNRGSFMSYDGMVHKHEKLA
jgi:hypothetical protein